MKKKNNDYVVRNSSETFVNDRLFYKYQDEDILEKHCIVCKRFCGLECDSKGFPTSHGLCISPDNLYEIHEKNDTCKYFEIKKEF